MIFIDTNYFLRFLLQDNEAQHFQAKSLFFKSAQGKVKLTSSTVVFFEIYFVLKSFYKKDKQSLVATLIKILSLSVEFSEQQLLHESLNLYNESSIGLEDCYNVVYSRKMKAEEFRTFDMKLDKMAKAVMRKGA